MKEYILISSLELSVEQYTKQTNGFWYFREFSNSEDKFHIETIGFSCMVNDLYRKVSFEVKD